MKPMSKLEQMRAARAQREEPTVAPLQAALQLGREALRRERDVTAKLSEEIAALSLIVTTDLGKQVIEVIKADIADRYEDELRKILGSKSPVQVTFRQDDLRFFQNPADGMLTEALRKMEKAARATAERVTESKSTRLTVRIPNITVHREMVDMVAGTGIEPATPAL